MKKGRATAAPAKRSKTPKRSASACATRAVRQGKLLTAETPKERSPKQENL